jgi:two-component system sensor histidine kinase BaeS
MKIRLAYKLFGALFLTLLVVIGALMLSRFLFARNFKQYIYQVEVERLKNLVPLLEEEYRNSNGWQGIKSNRRYWRRRLWHEIQLHDPALPGEKTKKGVMVHHRSGPENADIKIRYLLSDADLNPIIGKPLRRDKPQLVPISVEGRTVGWLGLTHTKQFPKGPTADFFQQQYRLYSLLGLVVFVITILIAVLLTRHLLRPVKRLTEGTRTLAKRDFSVRIKETGPDEFGQLAQHFNSMAQTLQTYERMRKQWLSDISHELRTPLAILRGEIEALLDGVRQPTQENLKSLHVETLRIGKLVEDLHLLSMADSNELILKMELHFARGCARYDC